MGPGRRVGACRPSRDESSGHLFLARGDVLGLPRRRLDRDVRADVPDLSGARRLGRRIGASLFYHEGREEHEGGFREAGR